MKILNWIVSSILIYAFFCAHSLGEVTWASRDICVDASNNANLIPGYFAFTNMSNYAVKIKKIMLQCGCTEATWDRSVYLPGESGQIVVIFDRNGRSLPERKHLVVFTDDPDDPVAVLSLSVAPPRSIEFVPRMVSWAVGQRPSAQMMTIRSLSQTRFRVVRIRKMGDILVRHELGQEESEHRLWIQSSDTSIVSRGTITVEIQQGNNWGTDAYQAVVSVLPQTSAPGSGVKLPVAEPIGHLLPAPQDSVAVGPKAAIVAYFIILGLGMLGWRWARERLVTTSSSPLDSVADRTPSVSVGPPFGSFRKFTLLRMNSMLCDFGYLRIPLSILLLIAASLKGYELVQYGRIPYRMGMLQWFVVGVIVVETLVGTLLLVGWGLKYCWRITFALFTVFAVLSIYRGVTGQSSCGCFGDASLNPWHSALLDLAVILMLGCCRGLGVDRDRKSEILFYGLLSAALAVGVFVPMFVVLDQWAGRRSGHERIVVQRAIPLEPDSWNGLQFPLMSYIDIRDRLVEGKWMVLLYRYNCDECMRVIEGYLRGSLGSAQEGLRIALVELPPYTTSAITWSEVESRLTAGKLSDGVDWEIEVPMEVRLDQGKVVLFVRRHMSNHFVDRPG